MYVCFLAQLLANLGNLCKSLHFFSQLQRRTYLCLFCPSHRWLRSWDEKTSGGQVTVCNR